MGSEWRERGREGQRRGEESPRVRWRSSSIRGIRICVLRSRRRRRERVAGNDRARRSTPRARRERATATERGRARTLVSAALEQRLDEDHRRLVVLHEEDVELGLRATALREERGRVRGAILRGIGLRGRRLGGFRRRPRLVSRRHRVRRLAEPRNRLARAPRSRRRSRRAREAGSLRDRRPRGTSASNEPRTTKRRERARRAPAPGACARRRRLARALGSVSEGTFERRRRASGGRVVARVCVARRGAGRRGCTRGAPTEEGGLCGVRYFSGTRGRVEHRWNPSTVPKSKMTPSRPATAHHVSR